MVGIVLLPAPMVVIPSCSHTCGLFLPVLTPVGYSSFLLPSVVITLPSCPVWIILSCSHRGFIPVSLLVVDIPEHQCR